MDGPDDPRLSLAFMRSHPAQAARVLEALPGADAARLFERVPARLGSDVLAAMLPQSAARCIDALADERALELLAAMGTQPAVGVLRQVHDTRRRQLMAGLPTGAALASTLLLRQAEDSLGAWADPDVLALPAETRVDAALQRLRQAPGAQAMVWVVDGQRRLAGSVAVPVLLQAPSAGTLASLLQPASALLPAHAPLAGSLEHPAWRRASLLPVVEGGDRLLGVLSHDALLRAVQRQAPQRAEHAVGGLPALFAHAYWQALSGLVETGLGLLPRVPPLADPARGD